MSRKNISWFAGAKIFALLASISLAGGAWAANELVSSISGSTLTVENYSTASTWGYGGSTVADSGYGATICIPVGTAGLPAGAPITLTSINIGYVSGNSPASKLQIVDTDGTTTYTSVSYTANDSSNKLTKDSSNSVNGNFYSFSGSGCTLVVGETYTIKFLNSSDGVMTSVRYYCATTSATIINGVAFSNGNYRPIFELKGEVGLALAESEVDGSNNLTLTASEDSIYVVDSAATYNSITFNVAEGKTLALSGAKLTASNGITINDGTVFTVSSASLAGTVKGDGTLLYYGISALPTGMTFTDSDWAGTLAFENITAKLGYAFASLGNSNSTVKLTNVSAGYLNDSNNTVVAPTVEIDGAGFTINDGNSQRVVYFTNLTGNGVLKFTGGSSSGCGMVIKGWSGFTGTINVSTTYYEVTFGDSGTYAASGNSGKILVSADKTVTIPSDTAWSATGGIVVNGTLVLSDGAVAPKLDSASTGTISIPSGTGRAGAADTATSVTWSVADGAGAIFGLTTNTGTFSPSFASGVTPANINAKVVRIDGGYATATWDGDNNYFTYDTTTHPVTYGGTDGALYDATFTNTTAMAYASGASVRNTGVYNNTYADKTTGIRLYQTPWIATTGQSVISDFANIQGSMTVVVAGQMSPTAGSIFLHMGYSTEAYKGLIFARTANDNEVLIGYNSGATVTALTTMIVPNATTARHVYAVTKYDDPNDSDKTTFTVYLDGIKWKVVKLDEQLTFTSGGVQVGSDFGGRIYNAGIYRNVTDTSDTGYVNFIRIYNKVLTESEIALFSSDEYEYPYNSPYGNSVRTFTADGNWVETESTPWANTPNGGVETAAGAPLAGSSLTVSADNASGVTVSVNLDSDTTYEALTLNGDPIAFEFAEGKTGVIKATGAITIGAETTIKAGALEVGGATTILDNGVAKLIFDYSDYDASGVTVANPQTTPLVLASMDEQEEGLVTCTVPTTQHRVYSFGYANGGYNLTITAKQATLNGEDEDTFAGALSDAVDGDTVGINEDVTVTGLDLSEKALTLNIPAGLTLTVTGEITGSNALTLTGAGTLVVPVGTTFANLTSASTKIGVSGAVAKGTTLFTVGSGTYSPTTVETETYGDVHYTLTDGAYVLGKTYWWKNTSGGTAEDAHSSTRLANWTETDGGTDDASECPLIFDTAVFSKQDATVRPDADMNFNIVVEKSVTFEGRNSSTISFCNFEDASLTISANAKASFTSNNGGSKNVQFKVYGKVTGPETATLAIAAGTGSSYSTTDFYGDASEFYGTVDFHTTDGIRKARINSYTTIDNQKVFDGSNAIWQNGLTGKYSCRPSGNGASGYTIFANNSTVYKFGSFNGYIPNSYAANYQVTLQLGENLDKNSALRGSWYQKNANYGGTVKWLAQTATLTNAVQNAYEVDLMGGGNVYVATNDVEDSETAYVPTILKFASFTSEDTTRGDNGVTSGGYLVFDSENSAIAENIISKITVADSTAVGFDSSETFTAAAPSALATGISFNKKGTGVITLTSVTSLGTVTVAEGAGALIVPDGTTYTLGTDTVVDAGYTTDIKLIPLSAAAASVTTGGVTSYYSTLADAVTALGTDAGTLTLLANTESALTLVPDQTLVAGEFTTGGVSIAGGVENGYELKNENGTYTLVDNRTSTWIASEEGSWGVAANWSTGYVPTEYTTVTFNDGAAVTLNSGKTVASVVVNGEVAISANPQQSLNTSGNVTGDGTLTLSDVCLASANADGIAVADTVAVNFTNDSELARTAEGYAGVTLNGDVTISDTFKVWDVQHNINGTLTINSGASLTLGSNLFVNGAATVKGAFTRSNNGCIKFFSQLTIEDGAVVIDGSGGNFGDEVTVVLARASASVTDSRGQPIADNKVSTTVAGSYVKKVVNGYANTFSVDTYKTVTFVDEDGETVLQTTGNLKIGDEVSYTGETPTKAATAQYTYTFAGWTPEITAVTADATYTATYSSTVNEYTITWKNDDGSTIDTTVVAYGDTPTHADATKAPTTQYTYTFAGWTPEVVAVTGAAEYSATYSSTVNNYKVTIPTVEHASTVVVTVGDDVIPLADGGYTVPYGSTVTITYTADDGYFFGNSTEKVVEIASVEGDTAVPAEQAGSTSAAVAQDSDGTYYADVMTGLYWLVTPANLESGYLQLLGETTGANVYGAYDIGYDAASKRYAKAVASIDLEGTDDPGYLTVQAALDAAENGALVRIKANNSEALTLANGKSVTINAKKGDVIYDYTAPVAEDATYKVVAGETVDGSTNFTGTDWETWTLSLGTHPNATVTGLPAAVSEGAANKTVSFTVAADATYKITAVKVDGVAQVGDNGTYTYTVSGDATVTVETELDVKTFTVVVPANTTVTVTGATDNGDGSYTATIGDTVTITYAAAGAYVAGGTQSQSITVGADTDSIAAPTDYTVTAAVAQIGSTYYADLATALNAAVANDTVTLLADYTAPAELWVSKSLTLDLGGNTLGCSALRNNETTPRTLTADAGTVVVRNGTIEGRVNVYDSVAFTLAQDATVDGYVVVWGTGTYGESGCLTPTLNVYGTITNTGDAAISCNGTDLSGAVINIYDGAVVTSTDDVAIFLPSGNLTVTGGTITGATGIYAKSGSVTVTGGTITGNGAAADYVYRGDGATATGDAIVIDNAGYPGGTPAAELTGGTFVSANGKSVASYVATDSEAYTGSATFTRVENIIPATSTARFSDATADGVAAGYTLVAVENTDPVVYEVAALAGIQYYNSWSVPNVFYFDDEDPVPSRTTQGTVPKIKRTGESSYHAVEDWVTITWTVTASDAADASTPDDTIATVDDSGLVTFTAPGTVKVWLTMTDPSGATKSASKTVKYASAPAYVVSADGQTRTAYATLLAAFNHAQTGETVVLGADATVSNIARMTLKDGRALTLDLNGHTVTCSVNFSGTGSIFNIQSGSLSVVDTGATKGGIAATGNGGRVFSMETADNATTALSIGEGVNISSAKEVCVYLQGDATLNTAGNLTAASDFAICGNGSAGNGGTVINVTGGTVTGDEIAIYQPQDGALNISGGTITGGTAVYVKSGSVTVTGGTLVGNGTLTAYTYNGNGANATGDALVIDNCGYPGGVPAVSITGGTFTSANAYPVGSYTKDDSFDTVIEFISGGTFSHAVLLAYCAEGYMPKDNGNGTYGVAEGTPVAQNFNTGVYYSTLASAVSEASAGDTITVLVDEIELTSTIEIDKNLTIDLGAGGCDVIARDCRAFWVKAGSFTLTGWGYVSTEVSENTTLADSSSVIRVGSNDAVTSFTLDESVSVTSDYCYGITYFGAKKQTVVIDGYVMVHGTQAALSGNGSAAYNTAEGGSDVTVNGSVWSTETYAIYSPETGTLTINGEVEGMGGIEVKAGTVVINSGATIISYVEEEEELAHTTNNNGTSTSGYAIAAIGNANYAGEPEVVINGGTITGFTIALAEANAPAIGTVTAKSNALQIPEGYKWYATETPGVYELAAFYTITWNFNNGADSLVEEIRDGEAVTAPADPVKEGYTFTGWTPAVVSPAVADATYTAQFEESQTPVTDGIKIETIIAAEDALNSDAETTIVLCEEDGTESDTEQSTATGNYVANDVSVSVGETKYFKVKQGATESAVYGVTSPNTTKKLNIVAVPFAAIGDSSTTVKVAKILDTGKLNADDKVYVYGDDDTYNVWELTVDGTTNTKTWDPVTMVKVSDTTDTTETTSMEFADAEVARGGAFWVELANDESQIVLIGQVATAVASKTVEAGTASAPKFTLCASPKATAFDLNGDGAFTGDIASTEKLYEPGDTIQLSSDGGVPTIFYYMGGKWKHEVKSGFTKTWSEDSKIPAGTGFWYISRGGAPTINW